MKAVAAVNNNTIVVVNTVGPIMVDAWIENPNITGLVCPVYGPHENVCAHGTFVGLERLAWAGGW